MKHAFKSQLRYAPAATVIVFLLAVAAGISTQFHRIIQFMSPYQKITLANNASFLGVPVIIASENNFFSRYNLDAQVDNKVQSGHEAFSRVATGSADFATGSSFALASLLVEHPEYQDSLRIIANLVQAYKHHGIIVHNDIVSSVAELKGKKIGVAAGTNAEYFLDLFLQENNISEKNVVVVKLSGSTIVSSFKNKEVDAIVTANPNLTLAQDMLGIKATTYYSDQAYSPNFVLVTTREILTTKPELAEGVVHALHDATIEFHHHPEPSLEIVRLHFDLDQEKLKMILASFYRFDLSMPESLATEFDKEIIWNSARTQTSDLTLMKMSNSLIDTSIITKFDHKQ